MNGLEQRERHTAVTDLARSLRNELAVLEVAIDAALDEHATEVTALIRAARDEARTESGHALNDTRVSLDEIRESIVTARRICVQELVMATDPLRRGLLGRLHWLLRGR